MKYVLVCLSLLLSSITVMGAEPQDIAEQYVNAFMKKEFSQAETLMYCSPDSPERIKKDREWIRKSMSVFIEEFGEVKSYKTAKNNLFSAASIGCVSKKFLEENEPYMQIVYELEHLDNVAGYVLLRFSKVNSESVLVHAGHGKPVLESNGTSKVMHVVNRISNL